MQWSVTKHNASTLLLHKKIAILIMKL